MRYAGWSQGKKHEAKTATGVKRGYRITVAVTQDAMSDLDVNDLPALDEVFGDDGVSIAQLAVFQRAYVDEINENSGIISFTLCKFEAPHARTRSKGSLQIHDEGKTWAPGWGDETLQVLRATYNLSGDE